MNKTQILVLVAALALLLGLYILPVRPSTDAVQRSTRSMAMEATDKVALLNKAKEKYTAEQLTDVRQLTDLLNSAKADTTKAKWLEKLSGAWYRVGEPSLAGIYAQEIAEIRNDANSWAIAGTTYSLAVRQSQDATVKQFSQGRAIKALENAISLDPSDSKHRVNLALCYVEIPPKDNPMKGILMLRDLLDKHPEDVGVLTQLGALAIRTGQYEKAEERLSKAYTLAPSKQIAAMLSAVYGELGNAAKSAEFKELSK